MNEKEKRLLSASCIIQMGYILRNMLEQGIDPSEYIDFEMEKRMYAYHCRAICGEVSKVKEDILTFEEWICPKSPSKFEREEPIYTYEDMLACHKWTIQNEELKRRPEVCPTNIGKDK